MTIIDSHGGRTYYLNGFGRVKYIIGYNGARGYPYTHDRKYIYCSGRMSYKYFRRLENSEKLFFNQYKPPP